MSHNNKKSGFTLIELLVSIAVFTIVMTVAVSSLIGVIDANRKAQTIKSVVNNLNFALESMSKNIRTGSHYKCYANGAVLSSSVTGPCADGIAFISQTGRNAIVYAYTTAGKKIVRCTTPDSATIVDDFVGQVEGNCGLGSTSFVDMTSAEVVIEKASFILTGESTSDQLQPRVLLTLSGYAGERLTTQTSFTLSTSATQRVADITQ